MPGRHPPVGRLALVDVEEKTFELGPERALPEVGVERDGETADEDAD